MNKRSAEGGGNRPGGRRQALHPCPARGAGPWAGPRVEGKASISWPCPPAARAACRGLSTGEGAARRSRWPRPVPREESSPEGRDLRALPFNRSMYGQV